MATRRPDGRQRLDMLPRQAQLAHWATPLASDSSGGGQVKRYLNPDRSSDLKDCVKLAEMESPARLTACGQMLIGCSAGMENGGQLNPAHSR